MKELDDTMDLTEKRTKRKKEKEKEKEQEPEPEQEQEQEQKPEERMVDADSTGETEPQEVQDFEKFGVGPVTVPVRDATEMMARLEEAKVSSTMLRKSVTDLSHENKFWREYALKTHGWAQEIKKRLDEAKRHGKSELEIPPFPEAPFIITQQPQPGQQVPRQTRSNRNDDDDDDDKTYLKTLGKVLGPYLMLGKYLKEGDGKESQADATTIKRVDPDGTTSYIPAAWMHPGYAYQQSQQPHPQNDRTAEIAAAMTELTKTIAVLNEKVRTLESRPQQLATAAPTGVAAANDMLSLFTNIRNILIPVTSQSASELQQAEVEKERIKQTEETKRKQIEAQNRMLGVYERIINVDMADPKASRPDDTAKLGRDFIDRATEEVKRLSAEV